jgi:transcriptional regulator with XRE-family HTH domain
MANALARRRRLGAALMDLRTDREVTHAALAAASGVSATVISRLENPVENIGRRPNLLTVRKLLDALDVPRGSKERDTIEGYAETGAARGWWDDAPIGERLRTFARVEDGTAEIGEYGVFLLPGMVQHRDYARHRALLGGSSVDVDAVVNGRLQRQRILAGPTPVTYRLVLEEQTVRRLPVPPAVMATQLEHLLDLMTAPTISVRIIPVDARLDDGAFPQSPFAHMTYSDPADPQIVAVDTVTEDLLVTGAAEVEGYAQLHQRLRDAALSDEDSAVLIRQVADQLAIMV